MKFKVVTTYDYDDDAETLEYETQFFNLTNPGENLDFQFIQDCIKASFDGVEKEVEDAGPNSTDKFLKQIN